MAAHVVCYHMKSRTRITLLTVGTMVLVFVGVNLVLHQSAAFTTLGILLVILSAIVFLVDVKDVLLLTDRKVGK